MAADSENPMDGASSNSQNVHLIQTLVETHEARIRQYIRARSGPKLLRSTTLEDLFQETVAEALASADDFVFYDQRRFIAWICTIARRTISRSAHVPDGRPQTIRIKRAGSSGVGVPESRLLAQVRTPSSVAAGRENWSILSDAIRELPQHYCRALTLYYIEERAIGQVAKIMGRSKGAAAQLILRAIRALRGTLSEQ